MFNRKKKKTGCETPEFRSKVPMPPVKPAKEKENKTMYGLNPITMQCTYSTPCGYCTKWDKKCDKKIGPGRGQRVNINPIDDAIDEPIGVVVNKICKTDSDHEWECCGISTAGSDFICKKCYAYKTIPYRTEELEVHST